MSDQQARREANTRRVDRMNVWIELAEESPKGDRAHVRFVFYWIAYEAAYAAYRPEPPRRKDFELRQEFHKRLARHDRGCILNLLRTNRKDIVAIFELRQASRCFWNKQDLVSSREDWEQRFERCVREKTERLGEAIDQRGLDARTRRRCIRDTLDDLFKNLAVVRNQIAHGGSAGRQSRGRTQVLLGARLLEAFVPCFRDSIAANLDEDWGKPPFPRVGTGPDDECPPPWLHAEGG